MGRGRYYVKLFKNGQLVGEVRGTSPHGGIWERAFIKAQAVGADEWELVSK
jgi:hypothetical protein